MLREKEEKLIGTWEKVLNNAQHLGKSRYKIIPTMDVANFFRKQGWCIRTIQGSKTFSTHIVRMAHPDIKMGDDHVEIVIRNSYDGRTKLNIALGVFRFVCSNGLVVGDTFYSITQKHIGQNIETELENKYEKLVAQANRLIELKDKLHNIEVNRETLLNVAEKVAVKAIGEKKSMYLVDMDKLLKPVREADEKLTAWNVLNIVQEKVINGGVPYLVEETKVNKETKQEETVIALKRTKKRSDVLDMHKLNKMIFSEFTQLVA